MGSAQPAGFNPVALLKWRHFPILCLAVWCIAGAVLRSAPSRTVLTQVSSRADFFTPISGAWALASGLQIHTDFSTPLGLAYYLPYYWALKFFGDTHAVVHYVESGIFMVVSIMAFLLLKPPRYSWTVTGLGVTLISLLATSPCFFSDSPFVIYEGIGYNRLGIALGYLCLLAVAFPPLAEGGLKKRLEIQDALLLAAGLVWMTFVKLNYLPMNVTFIVAAGVASRLTLGTGLWRFCIVLGGAFLLMAMAFVLCFHIDVSAMFRDIHMAGEARSTYLLTQAPESDENNTSNWGVSALYVRALKVLILHQAELLLLLGTLLGGVGTAVVLSRTPIMRVFVYGALFLVVLAWDMLQNLFNAYGHSLPMIPFMWLFLLCVLERGLLVNENPAMAETARVVRGLTYKLVVVVIGCYIANLAIAHATAFAYDIRNPDGFANSGPNPGFNPDETIQAKGWEGLYMTATRDGDKPGISYAGQINQGLTLLRTNNLADKRVFVLDQINPFPMMLGTAYPTGQPVWMHAGGTYNQQNHLPAETVFAGTDVILVPKQPINGWGLQLLVLFYKPYIESNFVFVAENDCWRLFRRSNLSGN